MRSDRSRGETRAEGTADAADQRAREVNLEVEALQGQVSGLEALVDEPRAELDASEENASTEGGTAPFQRLTRSIYAAMHNQYRRARMTTSKDDLHRLVDALPAPKRDVARRQLEDLLAHEPGDGANVPETSEPWSGQGLFDMAGAAAGPRDLSRLHDKHADPQA